MPAPPAPSQAANADDIFRTFGRLVFDLAYRLEAMERQTRALHDSFQSQIETAHARIAELQAARPAVWQGDGREVVADGERKS